MKIEIRDFGPIDYLEFDLRKDLHLIYGDNAVGKSYATYCIYCLLKNVKGKALPPFVYPSHVGIPDDNSEMSKIIKSKLKILKTKIKISFTKEFLKNIESELRPLILKGLQNSLQNTFTALANLKNRYSNKNYSITINITSKERLIIFSDEEGNIDLKFEDDQLELDIVLKNTLTTKYSLLKNNKKEIGKPTEAEFIMEMRNYSFSFLQQILQKIDFNVRDIYYLPASRSGLYQALNAFTPIVAELTQNRFFIQNKSIELPSLSEPLADYFIDLSTVDKTRINKEFDEILSLLQSNILKGEVDYNEDTRRITYKPDNIDLVLNLSESSSMVAELSPLVLYFRHIINNKFSNSNTHDRYFYEYFYRSNKKTKSYDILFIEEPEAHLHPEIQIALIEVFAKLTKLNLKIFITSHSNYMFNKINNLIIGGEIEKTKIAVHHLVRGKNGTVRNKEMTISDDGISDENFQDVSEKLYNERMNFFNND